MARGIRWPVSAAGFVHDAENTEKALERMALGISNESGEDKTTSNASGTCQVSWGARLWLGWLLGITVIYGFWGHGVIHPVNALNGKPVPWLALEVPWAGVAVEPFLALAHIGTDAPDLRMALPSMFWWSVLLASVLVAFRYRSWRAALLGAVAAAGFVLLYDVFVVMTMLPAWRLVGLEPGMIVADLHSHTYRSRDGLISPEDNLSVHQDHGYNVVAVTDHDSPAGGFAAKAFRDAERPDLPAVLPGMEIGTPRRTWLLAIGLKRGIPLGTSVVGVEQMREWIRQVHEGHHGAVVAMSRVKTPSDIAWLVDMGVDAIAIGFGAA